MNTVKPKLFFCFLKVNKEVKFSSKITFGFMDLPDMAVDYTIFWIIGNSLLFTAFTLLGNSAFVEIVLSLAPLLTL